MTHKYCTLSFYKVLHIEMFISPLHIINCVTQYYTLNCKEVMHIINCLVQYSTFSIVKGNVLTSFALCEFSKDIALYGTVLYIMSFFLCTVLHIHYCL